MLKQELQAFHILWFICPSNNRFKTNLNALKMDGWRPKNVMSHEDIFQTRMTNIDTIIRFQSHQHTLTDSGTTS